MASFLTGYPALSEAQQQRFRDCVTRLLSGHILSPGRAISPDVDWQFLDRHSEIVADYLSFGGWLLEVDRRLGVARVIHRGGQQRVVLPKLESLTFCVLRLFYHEQRARLQEDDRCRLPVGELRERLIHAGAAQQYVTRAKLRDALRTLGRYQLVDLDRGFAGDDEDVVTISEVIEKVLSAERIEQYVAEMRQPDGSAPPDGEGEPTADEVDG